MFARDQHRAELQRLLRSFPVVALIGPRQVGKTTLARALAAGRAATHFDLEEDDRLDVIHAGRETFPLSTKVRAVACRQVAEKLAPLHS